MLIIPCDTDLTICKAELSIHIQGTSHKHTERCAAICPIHGVGTEEIVIQSVPSGKKQRNRCPLDLLWLLMQQSKPRICELVGKCYTDQPYLRCQGGLAAVDAHRKFSQPVKDAMRTLLTKMRRMQTVDTAFCSMEKQGIQTDGLLRKFDKLGISHIPLRKGYAEKRMPSLSEILQTVEDKSIIVDLHFEKWK